MGVLTATSGRSPSGKEACSVSQPIELGTVTWLAPGAECGDRRV